MKKSIFAIAMLLVISAVSFANPSLEDKKAIDGYLAALSDPDIDIQLNALKKLNDLKTQYPNYNMREFDNFLTSEIMEKSTASWMQSLSSEMESVRHSTLSVIVRLKSDFPNLDTSVFNSAVRKIMNNDPELHLQIDAKIAYLYLNNSELASKVTFSSQPDPGDVFTQIHQSMHSEFVEENPE